MINKGQFPNSIELDSRVRVRGPAAAGSLLFKLGPLKFNGRVTKSLLTSLSAFFALRSYQFTITARRARAAHSPSASLCGQFWLIGINYAASYITCSWVRLEWNEICVCVRDMGLVCRCCFGVLCKTIPECTKVPLNTTHITTRWHITLVP